MTRPGSLPASGSGAGSLRSRLALLGAASLVAFLIAEVGLRVVGIGPYPDWSPRGLHVADAELGLAPAKNADVIQEGREFRVRIRTDGRGLRSLPRPEDPDPTVLVIGDSFAFGHGVEDDEVLSAVLLRRLVSLGESRAWVANAGVSSYGTAQAAARFRRLGGELQPDVCVLVWFEGNDPFDDLRPGLTVDRGYVVRRGERVSPGRGLKLWIKRRSAVYRVLGDAFSNRSDEGPIPGDHPAFGFDLFRTPPLEAAAMALAATDRALADFAAACDEFGAVGLVAVVPTRYRADPAWWRRHVDRFGFREADFDLPRVSNHVRARCSDLGVASVDLIDDLRADDGPSSYFDQSVDEVHLGPVGHARVGDRLAREVHALLEAAAGR